MIRNRTRKLSVLRRALLTRSLTVPAWAGGFLGDIRDVPVPRFDAESKHHSVRGHQPRHEDGPTN